MPGTTAVRKCMWALFSGQLWIQRVTHNSTVAVITLLWGTRTGNRFCELVGKGTPDGGHSLFEGMET